MTTSDIIEYFRALPAEGRAELLDQLVVELAQDQFDESVADTWTAEIRRRMELSRSGQMEGQSWDVVRDDLRRRLAEGKTP